MAILVSRLDRAAEAQETAGAGPVADLPPGLARLGFDVGLEQPLQHTQHDPHRQL